MIGGGKNPTGKPFPRQKARRNDVFLAGLPHRMNIVVFVDNRVTDQANALIGNAFDRVDNYLKDVRVGAHLLEVIAQPRIVDVEIAVQQCGGAVDRTWENFNSPPSASTASRSLTMRPVTSLSLSLYSSPLK